MPSITMGVQMYGRVGKNECEEQDSEEMDITETK